SIHQKTHHWDRSTVAHNTVTVDRSKQSESIIGCTHLFVGSGEVQLCELEATDPYPQTSMYRRCSVLIRLDERHSYVIDNFLVAGGEEKEYHYSFHGAEAVVETEGLNLVRQDGGTYAGVDVPFGY